MLMDTRQLAAFCAVVERKSFSQAAERLGVTQPAVSLQIRSLEERLGQRLLDRSGRRVEPTEAGLVLYRGAQRLLALEEQLVEQVAAGDAGELHGRLEIGASSGPGGSVLPLLLCEFARRHPAVTIALSVFDTQTVIDLVARLELGLQESVRSAVRAGYGVTFISRSAIEADLDAGTLALARVEGLEPAREISLVRAAGRSATRNADAFVEFARERLA